MKHVYKVLLILVFLLLHQTPALAREQISDWYVKDLKTTIIVNHDSSLTITENILADCGTLPNKHGIYRVLPKKYKTIDGDFNLPIKIISIIDEKGSKLDYSTSSNSETITIKIGDSDRTVSGENFYQIKYQVKNTIRNTNHKFDELYWNVLGNYWDMEIDNFQAEIYFPNSINSNNANISYYTGSLNSKTSNLATYNWKESNVLVISGNGTFLKNQGVTVSVSFPKNIIKSYQSSFEDKYGFSFSDILLFLLFPIITSFFCLNFWKNNKFRFYSKKTIVPEFEIPDNLTPIEIGGLIKKGGLDKNSIAATIIHLGVLGYLKIERINEKFFIFNFTKFKIINTNKPVAKDLNELEQYILSIILGTTQEVKLENISMTISSHFMTLNRKILEQLNEKKLLDKEFKKKKETIFPISLVALWILGVLFSSFSLAFIFVSILSIIIVVIFFSSVSILTPEGFAVSNKIKGFKLYMEKAEKYRSRFQEQNDILDKLLPYAILFGITKEWLSKIKDIYGEDYINNYAASYMVGSFGLVDFTNSISSVSNNISNGVASAIANNKSSSSSGFGGGGGSGGGGGGGGGGGW